MGLDSDVAEVAPTQGAAGAASQRIRVWAWACLGIMGGLYFVTLRAALPPAFRLVMLEAIYCTPILLTVIFSVRARAMSEGVERVFWLCLGAANAILLGCELLLMWWVFAIDPAGPPRVCWPFHIMHGVAAVFFIGLLVSMSRLTQSSGAARSRVAFDAAALSVIAGALILRFYVRPIMGPAGASVGETLLGTGYPLFGLMMVCGTIGNVVGMKVDRWRAWDRLVAISLSMYAVAISLWPLWYTTAAGGSRNYERGLLDLVQFTGHWLLMMAAVYRLTEPGARPLRPLPPLAAGRFRWSNVVVPVVTVAAIPLFAYAAYSSMPGGWFWVYAVAATVMTTLVLGRSVVVALEHGVLFHRSITDPLTGLYNHRFFHDRLDQELEQAARYGESLSLIALDIDDFGAYNERHGHMAGDRLLVDAASLFQGVCTRSCTVARLGGDEFAVILPATELSEATVIARRMLDVLSIEAGERPGSVSVSAGVASFPMHAVDAERLMRVADGALFDAKESGKAGVVAYDTERVPDLSARERISRLERQNRLSAVRALAAAVDARDASTRDHSATVAHLARAVGVRMGWSEDDLRQLETAATLHDVGKIGIPDSLLNKRGPLSERETQQIRQHSVLGQQILSSAGLSEIMPVVRSHHEHWDGSGYPDGLAGEEIPLGARIIGVCDAYDTMVTDRPQSPPMRREDALALIEDEAGFRFDPACVAALRSVLLSSAQASVSR